MDITVRRFLEGEGPAADKKRNNRFKLIPSILKSSWVVKQAVGTTPVLLGNKLVTKYSRRAPRRAAGGGGGRHGQQPLLSTRGTHAPCALPQLIWQWCVAA